MIRITSYVGFPDILIHADTFQDADLSGFDFHRYLFEGFDMNGCSLRSFQGRGVIFKDSILRNADLTFANLVVARIINCVFDGAILKNAFLGGIQIRGGSFQYADFTETNLCRRNLSEVNLKGAILTGARYNHATVWPAGFLPEEHGAVLEL